MDISKMSFGDRMNLHFKIGVHLNVPFTDAEKEIVDEVDRVSSFDDTVNLTEKIFGFIGGKREHIQIPDVMSPSATGSENGDGDGQNGTGNTPNGTPSDNAGGNSSSASDKNDQGEKKNANGSSAPIGAGTGYVKNTLPSMFTQSSFDEQMGRKVNKQVRAVTITNLPIANIDNIILPYKKSQKMMNIHQYNVNNRTKQVMENIRSQYEKTLRNSRPIVAQLVQQFEMKKAADIQKRTSISRSGKIDCDRIFKYRVSDDIFARYATVADGKNHGMVMFIDWSSSMQMVTLDVLNQVVMLTQFCKRMGIPFEVYLFSSQHHILRDHLGIVNAENMEYDVLRKKMNQWKDEGRHKRNNANIKKEKFFETSSAWQESDNEMFALIQVLSSDMTAKEFTEGSFNLYALGQMITQHPSMYQGVRDPYGARVYAKNDLGQGNTPLDSTILAAMQIVPRFQEKNKVQIVNTVFLTDGESGHAPFYCSQYRDERSMVNCPLNKRQYDVYGYPTATDALMQMFRDYTGSTAIGFFISNSGGRYLDPSNDAKQTVKTMKENGFYDAPRKVKRFNYNYSRREYEKTADDAVNHGYDRLFIIPTNFDSEPQTVENALGALAADASLARIRNTFIKSVEKRSSSRGFINRFSDVISTPTR